MRRDLALAEFRLLSIEKQRLCRGAIPLFVMRAQGSGERIRQTCICGSAIGGFEEFPDAKLGEPEPPVSGPFDARLGTARRVHGLHGGNADRRAARADPRQINRSAWHLTRGRSRSGGARSSQPKPPTWQILEPGIVAIAAGADRSVARAFSEAWPHLAGVRSEIVTTRGSPDIAEHRQWFPRAGATGRRARMERSANARGGV